MNTLVFQNSSLFRLYAGRRKGIHIHTLRTKYNLKINTPWTLKKGPQRDVTVPKFGETVFGWYESSKNSEGKMQSPQLRLCSTYGGEGRRGFRINKKQTYTRKRSRPHQKSALLILLRDRKRTDISLNFCKFIRFKEAAHNVLYWSVHTRVSIRAICKTKRPHKKYSRKIK